MKKLLPFVKSVAVTFVLYFAFSLLLNYVFDDYEKIGRVAITSLLFSVIYHILIHFLGKWKKD